MKKLFLAALLLLTMIGTAAADDVQKVTTFPQLLDALNNNRDIELQNDIDASSYVKDFKDYLDYKSGDVYGRSVYTKTFNGNGKKITGLKSETTSDAYVALVRMANGAYIKDLTIEGMDVQGNYTVGGICAHAITSTFTNCHVTGKIKSDASGKGRIGGIIGEAHNTTITGCDANMTISCNGKEAGGIVGYGDVCTIISCKTYGSINTDGDQGSSYTGGIVGNSYQCTITDCINYSSTTGIGLYLGGIEGHGQASIITGCTNNGDVTAKNWVLYDGNNAGGISGYLKGGNITACTNNGKVQGEYYIGGIVGLAEMVPKDTLNIKNCYSHGQLTANKREVGGVIGRTESFSTFRSQFVERTKVYSIYVDNCLIDCNMHRNGKESEDWSVGKELYAYGTFTNCSFTRGSNTYKTKNTRISGSEISSGYATFRMNGSISDATCLWRQNIDCSKPVDATPVICYSSVAKEEHDIVYVNEGCTLVDGKYAPYAAVCTNVSTTPSNPHVYEDGICKNCEYPQGGVYYIDDADDYSKFTAAVNNGGTFISGQLMDDITLDVSKGWTAPAVGTATAPYAAVFNGNGYTITINADSSKGSQATALFGTVKDATLCNLFLKGNINAGDAQQASGLVNNVKGTDSNILNIVSSVNISSTRSADGAIGGLVAVNDCKELLFIDCRYDGTMDLNGKATGAAGFVGCNNADADADITDCLMAGTVTNKKSGDSSVCTFVRNLTNATYDLDNCYYLNDWGNDASKGTQTTADDMTSGKLACQLHWGQELDGTSTAMPYTLQQGITHTRTFSDVNPWGIVCLPFNMTVDTLYDDVTFYDPVSVTTANGKTVLNVEAYNDNEIIPAGTPVIFHRSDSTQIIVTFWCDEDSVFASEPNEDYFNSDWMISATYTDSPDNRDVYTISTDRNLGLVSSLNIPCYQGCIMFIGQGTKPTDVMLNIVSSDGPATGITTVNTAANTTDTAVRKQLRNGRLVIVTNGREYNAAGARLR